MSRLQAVPSWSGSMKVEGSEKGLFGSVEAAPMHPVSQLSIVKQTAATARKRRTLLLVRNALDEEAVAVIGIKVSSNPGDLLECVCTGSKSKNAAGERDGS